jgi:lipoprotein NlpI
LRALVLAVELTMCPSVCVSVLAGVLCAVDGATPSELLQSAERAFKEGKTELALNFANQAVKADAKRPDAYFLRGTLYESLRRHEEAIKDFDQTIALKPRAEDAYNHRGSEYLKLGKFDLAIKDFDKFLEFRPAQEPHHWRRGIAYYYAGKYDLGAKQFEAYRRVDDTDMENAIWHFLCVARSSDVVNARKHILPCRADSRVAMTYLYSMCQSSTPVQVMDRLFTVIKEKNPTAEELKERMFYSYLYVGLYYDVTGQKKVALEWVSKAVADYKIGHYMWDIAVVHRDVLRKELKVKD